MNRRQLLKSSLVMSLGAATMPAIAAIEGAENFSQELYKEALASGEPFLLDFTATW